MRDLDRTVAYDLRDLSDEQLNVFLNWLIKNDNNWSCFTPIELKDETVYYSEEEKQWLFYSSNADVVNALTLFEPQFKQGDKVLVRDCGISKWKERVYATKYNGDHYVENPYNEDELFSYKFIKPYEEEIKVGNWVKNREVITKFESFMSKDDLIKITNPQLIIMLENEFAN